MDISVIIPLYNEDESLKELCDWIVRVMQQNRFTYEIILVDDGSKDKSWEVIENLGKENTNIKGIRFRRNYGKSEVLSTDFKGIVEEGEILASLHKQIVVKVPIIKEGIKALKYFSNKNIRTNCTLVFSAGQALLAAKAGATYVSPFIGRLDDINQDGV